MRPDSYSGGLVITKKTDEKAITEYENYVKSLNILEFIELTDGYDLNKSFKREHIAIRQNYIVKYFNEWKKQTYITHLSDVINLNTHLSAKTQENIISQINKIDKILPVCTLYRLYNLYRLYKEGFLVKMKKNAYDCIVFTVKKSGVSKYINYAYLYFHSATYEVVCMCIGSNIISSDGEYRPDVIHANIIDYLELHFSDMFEEILEFIKHKSKIKFVQQFYTLGVEKDIRNGIDVGKYTVILFLLAWLKNGILRLLQLENKNTYKEYQLTMYDNSDEIFMNYLLDIYKLDTLKLFYKLISLSITIPPGDPKNIPNMPKFGQKIIPIESDLESRSIQYEPWKELYINELCNTLLINYICPGLSFTYSWIFIHSIDIHLFNNKDVIQKTLISDEIRKKTLHNIQSANHTGENYIVKQNPGAVVSFSEYVGRTVNDIKHLLLSEEYKKSVKCIFNHDYLFTKYMFDIVYTLLCLHQKLNVIHGDLHLNNTTVNHLKKEYLNIKDGGKIKCLYVVDNMLYEFKDEGIYGTIIDFSRSFLLTSNVSVQEKQIDTILKYYHALFPNFFKTHEAGLKEKLNNDFLSIYKLFASIDLYIHTDRLTKFIKLNNIKTSKTVVKLINDINNMAKTHLTEYVSNVITSDTKYTYQCKEFLKFFKQQTIPKDYELYNVYCFNSDMSYSMTSFNKFPTLIKNVRMKKDKEDEIINMPIKHDSNNKTVNIYSNNQFGFQIFEL